MIVMDTEKPICISNDIDVDDASTEELAIHSVTNIPIPIKAKTDPKRTWGERKYFLSWGVDENFNLGKGLGVPDEQFDDCCLVLQEVIQRYFPDEYEGENIGKCERWESINGLHSLTCLDLGVGLGQNLEMHIFSHEDKKDDRFDRDWLVHMTYDIHDPYDLLCFYECLLVYLRYTGMNLPSIYSKVVGTEEKEINTHYGEVKTERRNILAWSFKLPCLEEYTLDIARKLMEEHHLEPDRVLKNFVLKNRQGKIVIKIEDNKDGKPEWVVKDLRDPDQVIGFFSIIANKYKYPDRL